MSDGRPRSSPASSFDVASLAGVSRSAVSRAFTPGASIAEDTRRKVMAAARTLNYAPSAIARTLATRRSRIVAVMISELDNPFYALTLSCLSQSLQDEGHTLLLFTVPVAQNIDAMLPQLLAYQVDGVIVASAPLRSRVGSFCAGHNLPVVQLNRYTLQDEGRAVHCDNVGGGALVADLLLDLGHDRIAFVAGDEETSSSTDRESGFCNRLAARGRGLAGRVVGGFSYEGGMRAARGLMQSGQPPDAVFCANDLMALGLMDSLRTTYGLAIPGDISVVGFDNIPAAALGAYALTTIDQDVPRMAAEAVAMLLGAEPARAHRLTPCRLVERGSVTGRHTNTRNIGRSP